MLRCVKACRSIVRFAIRSSRKNVIAGEPGDRAVQEIIRAVYDQFLTNKVVALHPKNGSMAQKIEALSPFIKNQIPLKGQLTVYVCKKHICAFPVTSAVQLKELLRR